MDWVKTTPMLGDMPGDWLEGNMSAGLDPKHLYPDSEFHLIYLTRLYLIHVIIDIYHNTSILEGRDSFGFLKDND